MRLAVAERWIPGAGARWMMGAAASFALMAACAKGLGPRIPTYEKVFARSLFSLAATWWALRRAGVPARPGRPAILLLRGFLGFGGLACYFEAILRIPLGNAVLLQNTNPLFAGLFAALALGEAFRRSHAAAVALCLAGVALVAEPQPGAPLGGSLLGLASGVLSGAAYTTVRAASRTEHPLLIVLSFPLVAAPLCLLLGGGGFVWPRGAEWLWLLGLGLTTQAGQVCLTYGLRAETAARATQFGFLGVVLGILCGVALGDPLPGLSALAGAALILGALIWFRPAADGISSWPAPSARS